jgi:hypothetical protein
MRAEPNKRAPEYAPSEPVEFVLRRVCPPRSAGLEGAHYDIEKNVNGEWKRYFKMETDSWRFKTPVIEVGGVARDSSGTSVKRADPIIRPREASIASNSTRPTLLSDSLKRSLP